MVVHLFEQLLAAFVDITNASEINDKRGPFVGRVVPAFVELGHTSAREFPFEHQTRARRLVVTSNSYNFINHTFEPRAICLPHAEPDGCFARSQSFKYSKRMSKGGSK